MAKENTIEQQMNEKIDAILQAFAPTSAQKLLKKQNSPAVQFQTLLNSYKIKGAIIEFDKLLEYLKKELAAFGTFQTTKGKKFNAIYEFLKFLNENPQSIIDGGYTVLATTTQYSLNHNKSNEMWNLCIEVAIKYYSNESHIKKILENEERKQKLVDILSKTHLHQLSHFHPSLWELVSKEQVADNLMRPDYNFTIAGVTKEQYTIEKNNEYFTNNPKFYLKMLAILCCGECISHSELYAYNIYHILSNLEKEKLDQEDIENLKAIFNSKLFKEILELPTNYNFPPNEFISTNSHENATPGRLEDTPLLTNSYNPKEIQTLISSYSVSRKNVTKYSKWTQIDDFQHVEFTHSLCAQYKIGYGQKEFYTKIIFSLLPLEGAIAVFENHLQGSSAFIASILLSKIISILDSTDIPSSEKAAQLKTIFQSNFISEVFKTKETGKLKKTMQAAMEWLDDEGFRMFVSTNYTAFSFLDKSFVEGCIDLSSLNSLLDVRKRILLSVYLINTLKTSYPDESLIEFALENDVFVNEEQRGLFWALLLNNSNMSENFAKEKLIVIFDQIPLLQKIISSEKLLANNNLSKNIDYYITQYPSKVSELITELAMSEDRSVSENAYRKVFSKSNTLHKNTSFIKTCPKVVTLFLEFIEWNGEQLQAFFSTLNEQQIIDILNNSLTLTELSVHLDNFLTALIQYCTTKEELDSIWLKLDLSTIDSIVKYNAFNDASPAFVISLLRNHSQSLSSQNSKYKEFTSYLVKKCGGALVLKRNGLLQLYSTYITIELLPTEELEIYELCQEPIGCDLVFDFKLNEIKNLSIQKLKALIPTNEHILELIVEYQLVDYYANQFPSSILELLQQYPILLSGISEPNLTHYKSKLPEVQSADSDQISVVQQTPQPTQQFVNFLPFLNTSDYSELFRTGQTVFISNFFITPTPTQHPLFLPSAPFVDENEENDGELEAEIEKIDDTPAPQDQNTLLKIIQEQNKKIDSLQQQVGKLTTLLEEERNENNAFRSSVMSMFSRMEQAAPKASHVKNIEDENPNHKIHSFF